MWEIIIQFSCFFYSVNKLEEKKGEIHRLKETLRYVLTKCDMYGSSLYNGLNKLSKKSFFFPMKIEDIV